MKHIAVLSEQIAAVCPIDGVSSSGRIDFKPEATEEQKAAAEVVLKSFDPAAVDATEAAAKAAREAKKDALKKIDPASIKSVAELRDLVFKMAEVLGVR